MAKKGKKHRNMPQPVKLSNPQVVAQQATPPDDKAVLDDLLTKFEKERGRPTLVYWTTPLARISVGAELPLFDQLQACGKQEAIDLVLFTQGGDTEAPWRIVSLMREFCKEFSVLLPHRALSSGTLIAMGADKIVMTPLSVLGPIDPSRTHPLLPKREGAPEPEPISVQDMRHAMQLNKSG
jgi:sulfur relay (sulfurtransferase) DsrC/TusE family protein